MIKKKVVLGLDIGTTKIVLVAAEHLENQKIKILAKGEVKSKGLEGGMVKNVGSLAEAIAEVFAKTKQQYAFETDEVFIGISGEHIKNQTTTCYIDRPNSKELIEEKDLKLLEEELKRKKYEPGKEIIEFYPQKYIVDDSETDEPFGMQGSRFQVDFRVILGSSEEIEKIKFCLEKIGLRIVGITLQSLAASHWVLNENEKKEGVVLIDIGGGTTDVAIFKKNKLQDTYVIPSAGNQVTYDITCKYRQIDFEKAEELKKQAFASEPTDEKDMETYCHNTVQVTGYRNRITNVHMQNLSLVVSCRIFEIVAHIIEKYKKYFELDSDRMLSAGIVLTGGQAQQKYIEKLIKEVAENICGELEIPVYVADTDSFQNTQCENTQCSAYAVVMGLIKKHIDYQSMQQKNIVIDDVKKEPKNAKKNTIKIIFDKMLKGPREWFQNTLLAVD